MPVHKEARPGVRSLKPAPLRNEKNRASVNLHLRSFGSVRAKLISTSFILQRGDFILQFHTVTASKEGLNLFKRLWRCSSLGASCYWQFLVFCPHLQALWVQMRGGSSSNVGLPEALSTLWSVWKFWFTLKVVKMIKNGGQMGINNRSFNFLHVETNTTQTLS